MSQFRNLLHHYVHQQGDFHQDTRPAHTFWTGCGMIRREVFLDFGGFDPSLYPRPAIEDIELGYRLTRAGHRILLARDVLATHLKRWSLFEMVRTDIFRRGVPWMLLIKRSGTIETDLNVKPTQRICVVLTGLVLLAVLALPWNSLGAVVAGLGSRGDRLAQSRFLPLPRPPQGAGLRGGVTAVAPALLHLLRRIGPDRPVPVARSQPGAGFPFGRSNSPRAG